MNNLLYSLHNIPLTVRKYTKEFEQADNRRWYTEIIFHNKLDFDQSHALKTHSITNKQECLDLHEAAGCYLEILRAEAEYTRSATGQVDILRDEILSLGNDIKRNRIYWQLGKLKGCTFMQENAMEQSQWARQQMAENQKKIIKLLTGRQ